MASSTPDKGKDKPTDTNEDQAVVATTFPLNNLPTEAQTMVWVEVLDLPACHTFVLAVESRFPCGHGCCPNDDSHKDDNNGDDNDGDSSNYDDSEDDDIQWRFRVGPKRTQNDNSSYRQWKKLFALKNTGFQKAWDLVAGDVKSMTLERFMNCRHIEQGRWAQAALNPTNDLVIFEFEGIGSDKPFWWEDFLRDEDLNQDFQLLSDKLRGITKMAIHWRRTQEPADKGGPFMCPAGARGYLEPEPLDDNPTLCPQRKFCCEELSAFMAAFPSLKEFYIIVHPTLKLEKAFAEGYKKILQYHNYVLPCEDGSSHVIRSFSDTKYRYIEQASSFDIKTPYIRDHSPWISNVGPSSCIEGAVYEYKLFSDTAVNFFFDWDADLRKGLTGGILIAYPRT